MFHLRRGLLGLAFVSSLGFGATQAFAAPDQTRNDVCAPTGYAYFLPATVECDKCPGWGWCDGENTECQC